MLTSVENFELVPKAFLDQKRPSGRWVGPGRVGPPTRPRQPLRRRGAWPAGRSIKAARHAVHVTGRPGMGPVTHVAHQDGHTVAPVLGAVESYVLGFREAVDDEPDAATTAGGLSTGQPRTSAAATSSLSSSTPPAAIWSPARSSPPRPVTSASTTTEPAGSAPTACGAAQQPTAPSPNDSTSPSNSPTWVRNPGGRHTLNRNSTAFHSRTPSDGRDEKCQFRLRLRQSLVQCGQPGSGPGPRQGSQVGVCHLAVPADVVEPSVDVRQRVWPELVPPAIVYQPQTLPCLGRGGAQAHCEPDQRALNDRAHCEALDVSGPARHAFVVHVLARGERDENVCVQ